MLNQPYVLRILAIERQNELLKESQANRMARVVKKERSFQRTLTSLKCVMARFGEPLISLLRQLADQGSSFTDKTITHS